MSTATAEATTADPRSARLLSLDAFRGLTIVAMILVNNPGRWGDQYWPLAHADWHGWTPTDLIFPFFLFIVGTALAYSLRKYREAAQVQPAVYWRIARRTALLIALGWFPSLLFRALDYVAGAETSLHLDTLRLPGVLVRIGIVYCITSLIVLHVPLRAQVALGISVLLGYWALFAFLPTPHDYQANLSHEGNIAGVVDRAVLGTNHMYSGDRIVDPEGIVSTLTAVVTCLIGYWTGLFIQQRGANERTVGMLIAAGIVCAAVGYGWGYAFPINKKIWTSSYVLLAGGLAMVVLAMCLLKFDVWGWRKLARPWEIVGVNAIFVFVASGIFATALNRWRPEEVSAHQGLYNQIEAVLHDPAIASLGGDWLTDPKFVSLCYALLTVAFWWFVLWVMWRLGWTVRV